MPTTSSLAAARMILMDYAGGKRLFDSALAEREVRGHDELDPIHFVAAAMTDPAVPVATKAYMEHFGIFGYTEALDAAMGAIRPATSTVKVKKHGTNGLEVFNVDTARVMRALAQRFDLYIDGRMSSLSGETEDSTWSWYEQTIKASLELKDTPSIQALHAYGLWD